MPRKRRAMTSSHAREVKTAGHLNEHHFAQLIGGEVNKGSHTDKRDVVDSQHRSHSVKAGAWWQIFLYGEERWRSNTIFRGLGNISKIMIACLDAFPQDRKNYESDKRAAKLKLQPYMRLLLAELQKPDIFNAFIEKSLFDGGHADYLSIYPGAAKDGIEKKNFHIFHKRDVIETFAAAVDLRNSRARRVEEMDDQKVTFFSKIHKSNIGEIELRNDSDVHYREVKFRLNSPKTFDMLKRQITESREVTPQVTTWGGAINKFRPRQRQSAG